MEERHIIICRGVPASGKTSFAKNFIEKNQNYIRVNRDDIRKMIHCTKWNTEREALVKEIEKFIITVGLIEEHNIIIDDTNLATNTLNDLISFLKREENKHDFTFKIDIKDFKVSFKEAVKRDALRENPVGRKVIKDFFQRYFPEELQEEPLISYKIQNKELPRAIIVDIDNTIALNKGNRDIYDFSSIYKDEVNIPVATLTNYLINNNINPVHCIFITGRENSCEVETRKWIKEKLCFLKDFTLFMRETGDRRSNKEVKEEIFLREIENKWHILTVFEDNDSVVDMWRNKLNLLCLQV